MIQTINTPRTKNIADDYPFLISELLKFIEQHKILNPGEKHPLFDLIMEFGLKHDIDIELIGDAISSDVYFKSFIESDCKIHKYIPNDISESSIGEW